jgi:cold-inducible RNA-binding protein
MNIYVGNLSTETSEDELRAAFEAFGEVAMVRIVRDKATGASRGFGFVEMPAEDQAQTAIEQMNGKELQGNQLSVEVGRARTAPTGGGGRPMRGAGPRRGGGRPGGRPGGRGPGRGPGGGRGPSRGSDRGGGRYRG